MTSDCLSHQVRCCAFHPNVSYIASGSDDAAVRVWDLQQAKCVRLLCRHGHAGAVTCLAFRPDGVCLASGGEDGCLILWHLPSASSRRRLVAHQRPLWSLAFSQEGAQLATSADDCTLTVWDALGAARAREGGALTQGNDEPPAHSDELLIARLHSKHTPIVTVHYSSTNLLLAAGAFNPPP